jgi:hypothetical protein
MEGSPLPLRLVSIQLFITKICYMDLSDWPQKGHAVGSGWPLLANLGMCSTYWVAGKTNLRDQFFGCTYKNRVCVRVFIGVSIRTCMRIYVCSVFLKKKWIPSSQSTKHIISSSIFTERNQERAGREADWWNTCLSVPVVFAFLRRGAIRPLANSPP